MKDRNRYTVGFEWVSDIIFDKSTPATVIKKMLDIQERYKGMDIFFGNIDDDREVPIYEYESETEEQKEDRIMYEKEKAEYLRLKEKFKDDEKTWN